MSTKSVVQSPFQTRDESIAHWIDQQTALVRLPTDLYLEIICTLKLEDIASLCQTCYQLLNLTNNPTLISTLMSRLFLRHLPDSERKTIVERSDWASLRMHYHVNSNITKSVMHGNVIYGVESFLVDKERVFINLSKDYNKINVKGSNFIVLSDENKISVKDSGTIQILDLNTGLFTAPLNKQPSQTEQSEGEDIEFSGPFNCHVLDASCQKLISGCSNENKIVIWDLTTHAYEKTFCTGDKGIGGRGIRFLVLDVNKQKVFSCSLQSPAIDCGNHRRLYCSSGVIECILFDADEQRFITGHLNGAIRVWNRNEESFPQYLIGHTHPIKYLGLDADRRRLISASCDKTLKIWDLNTNTCVVTIPGFAGHDPSVIFNKEKLFFGTDRYEIEIWDLNTMTYEKTLHGHRAYVTCLALDTVKQKLFSGSYDGTIKIWDLNTSSCIADIVSDFWIKSLVWDGQRLFSEGSNKTLTRWDFGNCDETLFKLFASMLTHECSMKKEEAMNRFDRMPPKAKNAIYGELYAIMRPFSNDYFGCAEHAFHNLHGQSATNEQRAQAILNYLAKPYVEIAEMLTSNDPGRIALALVGFKSLQWGAKNAIYGELYAIMKPFSHDYFGCAEHAFHNLHGQNATHEQRAQAIRNYLRKEFYN